MCSARDVDRIPFPRILELFEYWETKCPPMPEIVASFAGWEPPRDASPQSPEEQAFAARSMGASVLPSSAIPDFVRQGLADWQREHAPPPEPVEALQPTEKQQKFFEQ